MSTLNETLTAHSKDDLILGAILTPAVTALRKVPNGQIFCHLDRWTLHRLIGRPERHPNERTPSRLTEQALQPLNGWTINHLERQNIFVKSKLH